MRGDQGIRRVDEEKDITKGFSLEPFPHTDRSQAPAGRARSSPSNLGSLYGRGNLWKVYDSKQRRSAIAHTGESFPGRSKYSWRHR